MLNFLLHFLKIIIILITTLLDIYRDSLNLEKWLFDQDALQEYLLICCQHPLGGLLDKPGR